MSTISKENKQTYIMGGFNLNLLNYHSHQYNTGEFLDIIYSNTFFPLITRPTRIPSHSATLIENIFTIFLYFRLKLCKNIKKTTALHIVIFRGIYNEGIAEYMIKF